MRNRVLFSALLMIFILLPLVGVIISNAYEKHMIAGIKNELTAYSFSILAIIEVENDTLMMPDELLETQFNVSQSGLYAVLTSVTSANRERNNEQTTQLAPSQSIPEQLWSSQSLLSVWQAQQFHQPSLGEHDFYLADIDAKAHFTYSITISYGSEEQPYPMTLHIIKQKDNLNKMMTEFHHQLLLGLAGLMAILLLFQYLWSIWTLKPLKTLRSELKSVEQGTSESLDAVYPTELSQVTDQLNLLLSAEQKQRQRYRNALSDLAHSLKTPLAVVQSQSQLSKLTQEQLGIINDMIEHQLRKAQSAGQSSWYLGTNVKPVIDKLISSLEKIYQDKSLKITYHLEAQLLFKGDEADLLEILGNLLDNACKACAYQVSLNISNQDGFTTMIVEDDGPGISPALREDILQRGTRADTYQHGHGIGLAIVRDLVDSYQGSIVIEKSERLNGARFSLKFPH